MKKIVRVILYLLLIVVVAIIGFAAFIHFSGIPKYEVEKVDFPQVEITPERVLQGEKIAAVQCIVCHRGSDDRLSGRKLGEIPPDFGEIYSANITQSKEKGIGNWTDEQIAYLLRTGVRPNGQFIPGYMPKFAHLSDEDLKSVIAFLRSDRPYVQASEITTVPSKPSFLTKLLCRGPFKKIAYPTAPIIEPDSSKLVELGKYLVTGRYDCYPCHSADFKTMNMEFPEKSGGYMGGGNMMVALNGNKRYTANITMDEETGIGRWTLEDFTNAMRNAKSKDGHTLRDPMLPYNGLTDMEVRAMWAYIQTVPKIKNVIDRRWDED